MATSSATGETLIRYIGVEVPSPENTMTVLLALSVSILMQ
jgi:hypothetical protein